MAYALDGATLCYPCSDALEAASMAAADVHLAYVSSDGKTITTWPGGTLARVTALWESRGCFGRKLTYVNAVAPDGSRWHGKNAGKGMSVMLRRSRGAK